MKNNNLYPLWLSEILSEIKNLARGLIQRSKWYDTFYDVSQSLTGSPEKMNKERQSLAQWKKMASSLFTKPLATATGKVLVIGQSNVESVILESFVLKAFEAAGLEPIVLSGPGSMVKEAYQAEKIDKRFIFQSFCPMPKLRAAKKVAQKIETFEHLIEFKHKGIGVGKFVASTMMRMLRQGNIPVDQPQIRSLMTSRLADSIAFAEGAFKMIEQFNPSAAIFVDRGYSPSGELYDACILKNIPCYSLNAAHRNNSLMLKRFTSNNADVHPSSLSKESWDAIVQMPWTDKLAKQVYDELAFCYSSGDWYSEAGTQINKSDADSSALRINLGLDPAKKTAVIFSHIFWDATFFWGTDLFRDYEDWFVQTVKAACSNPSINWIIKVHPANVVKNFRDGITDEPSEIQALQKFIGKLPSHVKVLPADWPISTFSLFHIMDYCLTVRGTVGIEAAMLGKRVLTAGTGRFDRYGFTTDFDSAADYLDALSRLEQYGPLSPEEKELATRYAYGVFIGRPILLSSFHLEFQKDPKATLKAGWKVNGYDEIMQIDDLRQLTEWIKSGKEDFLTLPAAEKKKN